MEAKAARQPKRASIRAASGTPIVKARVVAETTMPMARLRQTGSGKSSRAPVMQFAISTAEPKAEITRPASSHPKVGASTETTIPASTSVPSRRNHVRRLQRSIQGVAASEEATPTREPSVASCPVVASDVPNACPIGRSSGLRMAMLSRVTAAPRQSTASPTQTRTG